MKTLLRDCDAELAAWVRSKFQYSIGGYDMAVGILDDGALVGCFMFHAYNGHDVELSYFGPNTMDLGITRKIARIAVDELGVSRITVRTARNNKIIKRGIKKLGFEFEGIRKHGYGEYDAIMYGLYGRNLARMAGKALQ